MTQLHNFVSNHPVALGLLVASLAVWGVMEIRQGIKRRPEAVKAAHGSPLYVRGIVLIGVVVGVVLTRAHSLGPIWNGLGYVAFVLLWCGIALRLWSFHTLGRYFTFTVQTSGDQPVIDTGPYRFVRHPSYTGIILGYTGVLLLLSNWWFVLCIGLGLLGAIVFRILVEEKALFAELGEPYRDFAATRKRLVPFIW